MLPQRDEAVGGGTPREPGGPPGPTGPQPIGDRSVLQHGVERRGELGHVAWLHEQPRVTDHLRVAARP